MSLSVKAICASCRNLEVVDLSGSNITNSDVKALISRCPTISELTLLNSNKLTDDVFEHLSQKLKYLRVLKLGGNEHESQRSLTQEGL